LFADTAAERRSALEQARQLLAEGAVGQNHFEFYRYAIAAAVADRDSAGTARLCDELQAFTEGEPLPWVELLVNAARRATGTDGGQGDAMDAAVRGDFRWLCRKLLNNLPPGA
jgi:hypothetical protein